MLNGTERQYITIGTEVEIVQKNHQRTGELTHGFVKRL
ncbi:MAG: putative repeat protein (TIGR03833 family), partial [Arcticibacterium sp.]